MASVKPQPFPLIKKEPQLFPSLISFAIHMASVKPQNERTDIHTAYANDGWRLGKITVQFPDARYECRYNVYFHITDEEIWYPANRVRIHHNWVLVNESLINSCMSELEGSCSFAFFSFLSVFLVHLYYSGTIVLFQLDYSYVSCHVDNGSLLYVFWIGDDEQ